MRLLKLLPLLLMVSCIDLITQKTVYNSLYFKGGSWIEMARIDSMKLESNDFTLQFWVSGGEVDTNEAPTLFSIIDSTDKTILALLRDSNKQNSITTVINSKVSKHDISNLDWSGSENFYLISLLFSDISGVRMYVDSTIIFEVDSLIKIGGEKLIAGALANENRTILENFWYGYIDEIRLWNTRLADSTIKFQSKHSDKLGEYYRYTVNGEKKFTYLDSLIGIWRLNFEEPLSVIEDDSGYNNDGIIYTKTGYSVELSEKGAQ